MGYVQMTIDGKEEEVRTVSKKWVNKHSEATLKVESAEGQLLILREGLSVDDAKRLARGVEKVGCKVEIVVNITYGLV